MEKDLKIDYKKIILLAPYIWIGVLVFVIILMLANSWPSTIEEFRINNLNKANEFKKVNENKRLQVNEVARKLEKEKSDIDWCITNNSIKGIAWECFIFNK